MEPLNICNDENTNDEEAGEGSSKPNLKSDDEKDPSDQPPVEDTSEIKVKILLVKSKSTINLLLMYLDSSLFVTIFSCTARDLFISLLLGKIDLFCFFGSDRYN